MSAEVIHGDCRDLMRAMGPDSIDVIVTDPPYGIGADRKHYQASRSQAQYGTALAPKRDYGDTNWDHKRPAAEVFSEMLRVGKDAVVFGGNYFADLLPPSASWIVWDKDNGTTKFADFELAWTSHKRAARKVRWRWNGMFTAG